MPSGYPMLHKVRRIQIIDDNPSRTAGMYELIPFEINANMIDIAGCLTVS